MIFQNDSILCPTHRPKCKYPRLSSFPKIIPLIILFTFFMASTAYATANRYYLLKGSLGKHPVIMELNFERTNEIYGRYFILDTLKDMPLSGAIKDNHIELNESIDKLTENEKNSVKITLYQHSQQNWTGNRIKNNKTKLDFTLTPLKLLPPDANIDNYRQHLYKQNKYEYARLSYIHLEKSNPDNFMGYSLQWWVDPLSKMRFFTLTSGFYPRKLHKINQLLQSYLWRNIKEFYDCISEAPRTEKTWFLQTVNPTLITPNLLSVNIQSNYYCGGAHPDINHTSLNIDIKTEKELSLEDVLWVGEEKPLNQKPTSLSSHKEENVNNTKFFDYRNKTLAPWLIEQFKYYYPKQMIIKNANTTCNYGAEDVWSVPTWLLTPDGVAFSPYFPRVMRQCDNISWVIPYSVIKVYPGAKKITPPDTAKSINERKTRLMINII